MRFALADVPRVYTGQEVSAQDLNNLMQNAEMLEQIAYGPDKLFLSSWRMAPPVFRLHYNSARAYSRPDRVGNFPEIDLKSVDVWEGSFLYREGMHELRLGFQTQALNEQGPNYFAEGINLANLTGPTNKSVSLFLTIKYTGVPLKELTTTAKYQKYVKTWVYDTTKAAVYPQPGTNTPSFTLNASASTSKYTWTPASNTFNLSGYHEFKIDIDDLEFTPGEIVQVSFRIATRDFNSVYAGGLGTTYYFSMVYAQVAHNYFQESWTTIGQNAINSLSQLPTLVQNQRVLVNYFKTLDNPLRAAVWDQVMVGSSYFSFFSKWTDDIKSLLVTWGLAEDLNFLLLNHYSQQARYYVQRNWQNNNSLNVNYAITVNSYSAFTLQGILSAVPTPARHYRYPVKLTANASSIPQFIVAEPDDWTSWNPNAYPLNTKKYADLLLKSPFSYAGDTNYRPLSKVSNPAYYYRNVVASLDDYTARRGYFRFIGRYTNKHSSDPVQTFHTPLYDSSITQNSDTAIAGVTLDSGDFIFYKKPLRFQPRNQIDFGGFYFVRPSPYDGGVKYYSTTSSNPLGSTIDFFLGPLATPNANIPAYQYSDSFNFDLSPQSNTTRFYPALFGKHFNNVSNHNKFYIEHATDKYTDFSIDLHEASANWNNGKGPIQYAGFNESYSKRMFNKASYIATIRIAEVAARNSSFSISPSSRLNSFQLLTFSTLLAYLNTVNTKLNSVYKRVFGANGIHSLKYTPLFWMKPKSVLDHYESYLIPEDKSSDRLWKSMEANSIYFSQIRQADYLVVRGKNVSIGWGGFKRVYRDNPANNFLPSPLEVEFVESQNLTGQELETLIISLANLKGLNYGQRYFIQGEVYYAAETMGVP